VNITDVLDEIWTQVIEVTSIFVIPDWSGLVGLLPVIVLFGLIMPALTLLLLVTMVYLIRKPRTAVAFEEGPRMADLDAAGEPIFPPGLPHCRRDGLVFPSGNVRCEACRDELAVICPMCGLGRPAIVDTCTNCGLVLKVKQRAVAVRTTPGPKPGGAAAA
jgi:hypothetical protein